MYKFEVVFDEKAPEIKVFGAPFRQNTTKAVVKGACRRFGIAPQGLQVVGSHGSRLLLIMTDNDLGLAQQAIAEVLGGKIKQNDTRGG